MKSHIPALDLNKQHAAIETEITEAINRVIQKGSFILGDEVIAFQNEFAKYCNTSYAFGVASGTDALQLALLACGIGSGDEVITSAHTAVATVTAIEAVGARPVLVDIDRERFTLDPNLVKQSIGTNTRAIIPVHLYGCPVELDSIMNLASEKINIIEDCAQAHGAKYQEKNVGSWGNVSAFSFYPTKNIGAIGDGGAVCTNDPNLGKKFNYCDNMVGKKGISALSKASIVVLMKFKRQS
jgi:dTDP-4-amino-4,6-dideoxygalactose transaminase